jgi:hypothetical protein
MPPNLELDIDIADMAALSRDSIAKRGAMLSYIAELDEEVAARRHHYDPNLYRGNDTVADDIERIADAALAAVHSYWVRVIETSDQIAKDLINVAVEFHSKKTYYIVVDEALKRVTDGLAPLQTETKEILERYGDSCVEVKVLIIGCARLRSIKIFCQAMLLWKHREDVITYHNDTDVLNTSEAHGNRLLRLGQQYPNPHSSNKILTLKVLRDAMDEETRAIAQPLLDVLDVDVA